MHPADDSDSDTSLVRARVERRRVDPDAYNVFLKKPFGSRRRKPREIASVHVLLCARDIPLTPARLGDYKRLGRYWPKLLLKSL